VTAGPTEKSVRYLDMGDSSRARLVVSGKDAKELRRLPTARRYIAREGDIAEDNYSCAPNPSLQFQQRMM
jgi:hypothetical protein